MSISRLSIFFDVLNTFLEQIIMVCKCIFIICFKNVQDRLREYLLINDFEIFQKKFHEYLSSIFFMKRLFFS